MYDDVLIKNSRKVTKNKILKKNLMEFYYNILIKFI